MGLVLIKIMVVILALIVVAVIAAGTYFFVVSPTGKQIDSMKEWLKYAVTYAEKELGSGTGQIKLRQVYQMFIERFPWLAKWIQFSTFSEYVDEALVWLRNQLSSNKAVADLVNGYTLVVGENTGTAETDTETDTSETDTEN